MMLKNETFVVSLRMDMDHVNMLDALVEANARSKRSIVEILIAKAYEELDNDPEARINP